MQFDLQVGVGTLIVAKPLDAEVQSVYNMTVQVTDGTNFASTQVSTHQRAHASPPHIKLNDCFLLLGELYMLPLRACYNYLLLTMKCAFCHCL